jgi:hypothetical protein
MRECAQHALEGGPRIYPSARSGLVAHARHSNRALGSPFSQQGDRIGDSSLTSLWCLGGPD